MEIIRGLHNLQPLQGGSVATIGNFDGVHRGHQAIIERIQQKALELSAPTVLITFEPYPQEFFAGDKAAARLMRFREKMERFKELGVDKVLCLRFNAKLASLSAEDFIQRILVQGLQVKHLVVGDDFRFGHQRRGDITLLQQAARDFGFGLEDTPTVEYQGQRISSTRVRDALAKGDCTQMDALLGHHYFLAGRVAHGDKRGRTIGFPTANIHLRGKTAPVSGVFAVSVEGIDSAPLGAVANIGSRPTVDGIKKLLEPHILDFSSDIYGRHVKVNFLHFIRAEQRFDSLQALVAQIEKDSDQARQWLLENGIAIGKAP
ncbi:MAG: bifunctional riboflavin kinase/FAD synthetase [Gammaproteobacteria bacterium]|nr:bifunctional riboflavin kinase/FAD synthetase [Gammaproteobacteria bacterium]MDH5727706.1 bifunctional riboflavin kinase/FAD synthetase [Gammaproteobacteria bacterium]